MDFTKPNYFQKGMIPWNKGKKYHLKHEGQFKNGTRYQEWRKIVCKRDKYICVINNKDCKGKVVAHHILGWTSHPELRYEINNGITLCHAHHPKKRAEEKLLAPKFQELISQMN